jgi:transmembrane sensor
MGKVHKEYIWNLVARKLAGEATPEELRDLDTLLRDNPDLHYPLQTITDLWKHLGPQNSHEIEQAEKAFNAHLNRMGELKIDVHPAPAKTAKTAKTAVAKTAATLLLAALGLTWYYLRQPALAPAPAPAPATANLAARPNEDNEIATANGSRTHLSLPDGTKVWLNAGSHLDYPKNFGAIRREVNLTGEAFFDVATDAGKPFVIHTTKIDILVLGTSFNVKSYPADKTTEATLVRGSIQVLIHNRPSEKIILKPNEKLVVSNDDNLITPSAAPRRHADPANTFIGKPTFEEHTGAMIETSWVDNKLIFRDEPFSELAKEMERWYGVYIRFDNDALKDLQFTGIFQKETIIQALDALRLIAEFNYSIEGKQITIHD